MQKERLLPETGIIYRCMKDLFFSAKEEVIQIKTYCKNVDVLDFEFIRKSVFSCLDGKWSRNDVVRFIARYGGLDERYVRATISAGEKHKLFWVVDVVAKRIQDSIATRTISLPPIRYSERFDRNSRKIRLIGAQSVIHQCYEYVAVLATRELFGKKIGVYQCASISGRGQAYGKWAIEKWMKYDVKGTRYALKMDIQKCYPSIRKERLKELLHRDLHKNPNLLYLLDSLIDMFDCGISIGSHLSQWLCNYYLSYAYHFISEQLFAFRRHKDGTMSRVRMISHVLFYMDDIIVFGSNKQHLMWAMGLIRDYFRSVLYLTIKPNWRLFRVCYIKDGKMHGAFVDMMGFRFYRGKTSIRQGIFLRMRKKFLQVRKALDRREVIQTRTAQSIMSYWGWIKNTDSYKLSKCYDIARLVRVSRRIVSEDAKRNYMVA